jgi:DNA replication protein DnaC
VLAGASALFITAADLLLDLAKQDGARALERRLRHYARPTLLCVDEVGCAPRSTETPCGMRDPPVTVAAVTRS